MCSGLYGPHDFCVWPGCDVATSGSLNATQAAVRAGYSVRTAKDIGCQNLAELSIQQTISERMAERAGHAGVGMGVCFRRKTGIEA